MAIAASDIKVYGCASPPEDSSSTTGGAIDLTTRIIPSSATLWNTLADTIDAVSSNAGDTTQTLTITGRLATGVITTDVLSLNGTTPVLGVVTFQSILKMVVSGAHTGTVSVTQHTGAVALCALATGELTFRRMFYNISADVSGGSSRSFYDKCFYKNTHASLSLLSAVMTLTQNTTGTRLTIGLAAATGDSLTTANNVTAPSGITFATTPVNVPGTNLAASAYIGLWKCITLPAGTAAANTTDIETLSGSTVP